MSTSDAYSAITMEAGADLSAKQFYFVVMASDGQIDPCGAGLRADGVLYNKPTAAGKDALVAFAGVVKVVAGAAITRGAMVKSDGSGKAATATTTTFAMGRCLDTALADGDVVRVLLVSPGHNALS